MSAVDHFLAVPDIVTLLSSSAWATEQEAVKAAPVLRVTVSKAEVAVDDTVTS